MSQYPSNHYVRDSETGEVNHILTQFIENAYDTDIFNGYVFKAAHTLLEYYDCVLDNILNGHLEFETMLYNIDGIQLGREEAIQIINTDIVFLKLSQ